MTLNKSKVETLVETRILPLLRVDGGTVEVAEVDEAQRTVTLRFGGSYRGSPCRGVVLNEVVYPILKEVFVESIEVKMAD